MSLDKLVCEFEWTVAVAAFIVARERDSEMV